MTDTKLLLLDFDGTLADTFHIGHALVKKLCIYLTETEYREKFNGNLRDVQSALHATDHGDRCDHALDYLAEFAPEFKMHARPFAGMPELVKEASSAYTICIVSSSHDDLIAYFLDTYGLRDSVAGVYGIEESPRKDEKFKTIFLKYGVRAEDSLFVTDTLGDENEAASVGLPSIGVTWGFQDRTTLARGNPIGIVDTPNELRAAISGYFERR
jgi:phosphoglycolate phosphatase-like HAD superfamily hydrolase